MSAEDFAVRQLTAAKRDRRARSAAGPVRTVKVNAAAGEVALLLSGRDPRRIVIVSETEVITHGGTS